MANEFVARNGIIALNNSIITGSLIVTGSITGSLSGSVDGTASFATTSSFAITSSNTISASFATTSSFATTASFVLSAAASNLIFSGSVTASVDVAGTTFRIISGSSTFLFISSSGNAGIGTTIPTAKLQVSGTTNVVNFKGSGSLTTSSIFTVDGAAGRLFSVNDSLSGSLFSVNTIAGLPVVEAFSDNTVRIGQYGQRVLYVSQSRVGIGKETSLTANLDVSGSVNITGSLTTTGTITAQTLVVQVVTSSISFITGSTRFGGLTSDTHIFTGSVNISGSLTSNGNTVITGSLTIFSGSSIDFQVTDAGSLLGRSTLDSHNITGSFNISGSNTLTGSSTISGSVSIIDSSSISIPKILGNTAAPSIAAGTGAGTSPTVTVVGSDVAGMVRVRTGTTPTARATIATITFNTAYSTVPYVIFSPSNTGSAALSGSSHPYASASATSFAIIAGGTALSASTNFSWSYCVFG